jgi:uncharacterized membrane protein
VDSSATFPHRARRYLLAGFLALVPILVTWIVLDFVLTLLSRAGRPWVQAMGRVLEGVAPGATELLLHPWFEFCFAVATTLVGVYALGWATTNVLGTRLLQAFERMLERVPLVQAVYGSAKRLVAAFHDRPRGVQRVVLIRFPSPEMRAVGFVTRVMTDRSTGTEIAAVYVPTSPNPTSGYVELVPVSELIPTDWTLEEAMSLVVTGGANAPEGVRFHSEDKSPQYAGGTEGT